MIRRRAPLRRYTPLSRTTTVQARRRAQAARGSKPQVVAPKPPKRDRWASWRAHERTAVRRRSGGFCEVPGCRSAGAHTHHAFGRVHEPWASSQLSCIRLCLRHHELGHAEAAFREDFRDVATRNLLTWMRDALNFVYRPADWPEDRRRRWEALTTAAGSPPGYRG